MLVTIGKNISKSLLRRWFKEAFVRKVHDRQTETFLRVDFHWRNHDNIHPLNWSIWTYTDAFVGTGLEIYLKSDLTVKDYFIMMCCCGTMMNEYKISNQELFIHYSARYHWREMLEFIGLEEVVAPYREQDDILITRNIIIKAIIEKLIYDDMLIEQPECGIFQLNSDEAEVYEEYKSEFWINFNKEWLERYWEFMRLINSQ